MDFTVSPKAQTSIQNGAAGLVRQIDPKARTWTSPATGQVFKLRPISLGLMNRVRSNTTGKPRIPMVKVNYGGSWGEEPNPNDPIYLEALAEWTESQREKVAVFLFTSGIDIQIPASYRAEVEQYQPEATDLDLKYYYITSLIPASEYDALSNALVGQNSPTEDGIADATAGFPGTGER